MFYPLKSLFRRHLINLCRHNFGVAIAAFLTFSLVPTAAEAQFGKHNMDRFDVLNVGLGMSNRGLPIFVELEQSLDEHISAGLMASYRSYTEGGAAGAWRHQFLGLGAQGHYHFVELAPPAYIS